MSAIGAAFVFLAYCAAGFGITGVAVLVLTVIACFVDTRCEYCHTAPLTRLVLRTTFIGACICLALIGVIITAHVIEADLETVVVATGGLLFILLSVANPIVLHWKREYTHTALGTRYGRLEVHTKSGKLIASGRVARMNVFGTLGIASGEDEGKIKYWSSAMADEYVVTGWKKNM